MPTLTRRSHHPRSLRGARFVLATLCLAVCIPAADRTTAAADGAMPLPRYRLQPGQHFVYTGHEAAATRGGQLGLDRETSVYVVRANEDGSHRVIVTQSSRRFTERNGERTVQPERRNLLMVDVFPDGRIPRRATDSFGVLNRVLPRLPADASEVAEGWRFAAADVRISCTPRPSAAPDGFTFQFIPESGMWTIHQFSAAFEYDFDVLRGHVRGITGQHRVRGRDTRAEQERLVRVETMDVDTVKALAADIDLVDRAERTYTHEYAEAFATSDGTAATAHLDRAARAWSDAAPKLRSALLGAYAQGKVAGFAAMKDRITQQVQQNARVIGRTAPPWSVSDLEGRTHQLADYRGRVVVLDFWYRNCGWCIRAMPQISQLARAYEGKPVAVLGMNVDKDVKDAQFVVDTIGVDYPTLLTDRRIAGAYGVRAYPTLFVLDTHGRLRRIHRGYSGSLLEELSGVIDTLLAEAADETAG